MIPMPASQSAAEPPAPGAVEVAISSGAAPLARLAAEWRDLEAQAGTPPLYGPAWILTHVRAFERPERLVTLTARCSGQLIAVLPLVRERAWMRGVPIRRLRSATGGLCLRFDVSAGAAWNDSLAALMFRRVADWDAWDCLELRDVPAGGRAEALHRAAHAAGFRTGRWVSMQSRYLDPTSFAPRADLRRELGRTRRRMEEIGPLDFQTFVDPDPARLDEFFQLEVRGWKGRRGGNAVLRKGARQVQFFRELAAAAARQGQWRQHRLLCRGELIAASIGLCDHRGLYALRWCYEERFAKFGPGNLLIEAILDQCRAEKKTRLDLTGEDYPYKRVWTPLTLEHAILYVFRPSLPGSLLHRLKFGAG